MKNQFSRKSAIIYVSIFFFGCGGWLVARYFGERVDSPKVEDSSSATGDRLRLHSEQKAGKLPEFDHEMRAASALEQLNRDVRWSELSMVARDWAKESPFEALSWAIGLEDMVDRKTSMTSVYLQVLGEGNLESAMEILDKIPEGEFRDHALVMGILNLAELDLDRALALSGNISGRGMLNSSASMLVEKLVNEISPPRLTDLMNEMPFGAFRSALGGKLVDELAEKNADVALDWLMRQDKFDGMNAGIRKVAIAYANEDVSKGITVAGSIEDDALRGEFMRRLGASWGRKNPSAAGAWLRDRVQKIGFESNSDIAGGIIGEWVQWNHEEPFRELSEVKGGDDKERLLLMTVGHLASLNPERAAEKLGAMTIADETRVTGAYRQLAKSWSNRDSIQASMWIGELSEGVYRDAAIEVVIDHVLSRDSDIGAAWEWSELLKSERKKEIFQARIELLGGEHP